STLGYVELLVARQRGHATDRARSLLEQALARLGPQGECPDPSSVPAVVLSLADEALARGEAEVALARLSAIEIDDATTADQRMRLRDAELRALERAARPLPELERALDRLTEAVAEAGLPEGRWRLALRQGD